MPSTFDPFTQNVTFHRADGTPFNVSVADIDTFLQYDIRICINYGCQLGASLIILIILLLLTRPEKRKSAVFALNTAALSFNVARLICECIFFSTMWNEVYAYFSLDFSHVPGSAYANSILGVVLVLFVLICVEASLVFQVYLICATLRRRHRNALLWGSILVALVPVGFRTGFMVENCILIMGGVATLSIKWLESATNIVVTISICFFCAIFVTKLGYAIKQRKRLGVRKFGPMKVIFVMGCQTLFIPAIFSILMYVTPAVPELSSNVLTLVVISLPLSSIWAGSHVERTRQTVQFYSEPNLFNKLSYGDSMKQLSHISSPGAQAHCFSDPLAVRDTSLDVEKGHAHAHGISIERDISVTTSQRKGQA